MRDEFSGVVLDGVRRFGSRDVHRRSRRLARPVRRDEMAREMRWRIAGAAACGLAAAVAIALGMYSAACWALG
jgi:hypothetical protein